jgi:hypothetical protein
MSVVILQGSLFVQSFVSFMFRFMRSILTGDKWKELSDEIVRNINETEHQAHQFFEYTQVKVQENVGYVYLKTQEGVGDLYVKIQGGVGYIYVKLQEYNPFVVEIFGAQIAFGLILEFLCFYYLFTRGHLRWYDLVLVALWSLSRKF